MASPKPALPAKRGRKRVYPRHRESLQLARIGLNELPNSGLTAVQAHDLYERFLRLLESSKDWYEMETRRKLLVFGEVDGFVLGVADIRKNVMDYVWLQHKASKMAREMLALLRKEIASAPA